MEEKFWQEFEHLLNHQQIPSEQEGWFTLGDYVKKYKVSRTVGRARLWRLADKGVIERLKVSTNPTAPSYYRVKQ